MYWFPNFLAVVFEKQEISQQVVTRMQDLASDFSKTFPAVIPLDSHSGRGNPLPHPTPSPAFAQAPRCLDPNLGSPQLFSRGCAPALDR